MRGTGFMTLSANKLVVVLRAKRYNKCITTNRKLRQNVHMNIEYQSSKNLPNDKLFRLFLAVGWASEETTTHEMLEKFNIGFLNSTFVYSAWSGDELVGCVRVLSDLHFRSIIYDLTVLPEYQKNGIGKELIRRCREKCEESEWIVQTDKAKGFYEKIGFHENNSFLLTIPCKWF